jgi:hypothetical protein
MSNITNLLTKMKVKQASSIQFTDSVTFPENPSNGQIAFKGQILYIWSTLNGMSTWYPLTTVREKHVHTQGGPATTWNIDHQLGSDSVIYMVYDDDKTVLNVARSNITSNGFDLVFTESEAGKCVVFAAKEADTIFTIENMFSRAEDGDDIIINGNLIPSIDATWSMGQTGQVWKDMYLGPATLYIGDDVTISSTGVNIEPNAAATTVEEQPTFTSSSLHISKYTYNPGGGEVISKPMIKFNDVLTVGGDNKQVTFDVSNFSVTAGNFSIDETGTFSFGGSVTFSQVDGGTWA